MTHDPRAITAMAAVQKKERRGNWVNQKIHLAGRPRAVSGFANVSVYSSACVAVFRLPCCFWFLPPPTCCSLKVENTPYLLLPPPQPQHLPLANFCLSLWSHPRHHFFQGALSDLFQPLHSCNPLGCVFRDTLQLGIFPIHLLYFIAISYLIVFLPLPA